MKLKTSFVASTLPARFLLDNLEKLKIGRLVCGSESLRLSYQFLLKKYPSLEIVAVPTLRKSRLDFLKSEVTGSLEGIVVFHECCWRELDLVMLKFQPRVEHLPCVTLNSWHKLTEQELSNSSLMSRLLKARSKNLLRLLVHANQYKKNFDFYEVVDDNGNEDRIYVTVLKPEALKSLNRSDLCLKSNSLLMDTSSDQNSKNVIMVVATDNIQNSKQVEVFGQVIELCKKKGLNVLIKDHPNPMFRLNLDESTGQVLSPFTPFEVLDMPHRFKIGLFSTTLAFQPQKSISIAGLFSLPTESFLARKKHLLALPGCEKIHFVSDLSDIELLLESSGTL